ncbi:MAG: FAD-dependent oxidoreductase, partial [Oscillospiraceae bacterium]|nr:FAD-dependent oxidoreductase [Oscillospiraceae bacterium]
LEEGKRIAKLLEELGVDAINVTSACYDVYNRWLEPSSYEPGWRAYLAREIKSVVSIPVIAANFMRSPEQAERQLAEGYQDFIGSARSFICEPHWVKKLEEGRRPEIRRCIGCLHCISSFMEGAKVGKNGECALNPGVGREPEYEQPIKDGAGRRIVVVGAGIAGLTAAETMARRGFAVTVFERAEKPGGQVRLAAACNLRDKLMWCVEDRLAALDALGVELRFGVEADAETIRALKPYAVITATGSSPVRPGSIPGSRLPTVHTPPEIIERKVVLRGERVLVAGSGMTGLETAELLNETGNEVTVLEMADELAPGAWFQLVDDELERLEPQGTKFLTGHKLLRINPGEVVAEELRTGHQRHIPADSVVLSLGVRPENALEKQLSRMLPRVYAVGDAVSGGTIAHAVKTAYETCMWIK